MSEPTECKQCQVASNDGRSGLRNDAACLLPWCATANVSLLVATHPVWQQSLVCDLQNFRKKCSYKLWQNIMLMLTPSGVVANILCINDLHGNLIAVSSISAMRLHSMFSHLDRSQVVLRYSCGLRMRHCVFPHQTMQFCIRRSPPKSQFVPEINWQAGEIIGESGCTSIGLGPIVGMGRSGCRNSANQARSGDRNR